MYSVEEDNQKSNFLCFRTRAVAMHNSWVEMIEQEGSAELIEGLRADEEAFHSVQHRIV